MNNTISQLLSFDAGIYNLEEIVENGQNNLPVIKNTSRVEENTNIQPFSFSDTTVNSLDYEIEEKLLSLIKDLDSLRRCTFVNLITEARLAIEMELLDNQDPDTKQSLSDLIELLKENADLVDLFQSYTNWLQKA